MNPPSSHPGPESSPLSRASTRPPPPNTVSPDPHPKPTKDDEDALPDELEVAPIQETDDDDENPLRHYATD